MTTAEQFISELRDGTYSLRVKTLTGSEHLRFPPGFSLMVEDKLLVFWPEEEANQKAMGVAAP